MDEQHEITRNEHRAASKMWEIFRHGTVAVGDFKDIVQRYRNYRKIPENTLMEKELLEDVVGDFLENCNWLAESRTYPGNARARMKWFFIHALEERMEASLGECEVGDMEWFEAVGWEEFTNNNLRLIKFVKPDGLNRAHDFWFATDVLYAHNHNMEHNSKYYHKWMMENDAVYKAAFEAEEAAKEDA